MFNIIDLKSPEKFHFLFESHSLDEFVAIHQITLVRGFH